MDQSEDTPHMPCLESMEVASPQNLDQDLAETASSKSPEPPKLSKKMERKLKKKEQWLANLPAKRAKEREKMKLKRKAARENNVILPSRKLLKQSTMDSSSCKIRIAIDLDFDELMNPRDLGKCVKQLMRCYTLNRRAENPMQLYFTSFNGKTKQEMSKNNGYSNWDVHFREGVYTDIFQQNEIVYLSSESENIITTLEESKVYIIGGLVDHNAHKGLCHRLAEEKNIAHGQLPISEFLELKTRKVLTIDHVFEILLGVSEGLSWKDAFLKVLPQRKLATGKGENIDGAIMAKIPGPIDLNRTDNDLQQPSSAVHAEGKVSSSHEKQMSNNLQCNTDISSDQNKVTLELEQSEPDSLNLRQPLGNA